MGVRERIIDAASSGFVRDGVLATRLEDISREAGVSIGAVYHHFPDKEALHADVWLLALAGYQQGLLDVLASSADAEQGIRGAVRHHVAFIARNPDRAALLRGTRPAGPLAAGRIRDQNGPFFAAVVAWWRLHAGYGALRDLPFELLHALWLGPAETFCGHWLEGPRKRIPTATIEVLADAAWTAVKGETG